MDDFDKARKADAQEGREFAAKFLSVSDLNAGDALYQCSELAEAASKLGKAGLRTFCDEICLGPDSSLFKTMRMIGDRLYDFESEKLDTDLIALCFLAIAPAEIVEKLVEIASSHRRAHYSVFIDEVLKLSPSQDDAGDLTDWLAD
jgi:hypothetical protein